MLATMHKNNVVHGDLTTSNILVRYDRVIRGLLRLDDDDDDDDDGNVVNVSSKQSWVGLRG